jgi:hypothetical protein
VKSAGGHQDREPGLDFVLNTVKYRLAFALPTKPFIALLSCYANAPTDEDPEDPGMVGIDDHVDGRETPRQL